MDYDNTSAGLRKKKSAQAALLVGQVKIEVRCFFTTFTLLLD